MSFYLAVKEMLRNKFRFIAIILTVALVTLLVLFLVAMSEGLTLSSSEYIKSVDAELFLFWDKADKSIASSSMGRPTLRSVAQVDGVEAVGPIGFSNATIVFTRGGVEERIDVALIGVEPGMPGAPDVTAGAELSDDRKKEVVVDQHVLDRVNLPVGSTITIEVLQGTEEKIYPLTVVGHTEGKKYSLPSIFVPLPIWDRIRPQEKIGGGDVIFNVAAVKLTTPDAAPQMIRSLEERVKGIEATDPVTTYQSAPGYTEMQTIMTMMQNFIMIVALLVIGGFFQIQALQKIPQIGMLKAIGASNRVVALTSLVQVMLAALIGMVIGGAGVLGLAAMMPPTVPIIFNGNKVLIGITTLFLIGPVSSFFSIRTLLKVEPLRALGLGV